MKIKFGFCNETKDAKSLSQIAFDNNVYGGEKINQAEIINNLYSVKKAFQIGWANFADESDVTQIGMGNYVNTTDVTNRLKAWQFGLMNLCECENKTNQFGVFNYRYDGNWYSRFSPIIAIRRGKKKALEKMLTKREIK